MNRALSAGPGSPGPVQSRHVGGHREIIQPSRGWSDEDWAQSLRRPRARGILDRYGRLTRTGGALRAIALAAPVSRHLIDSGVVPVPNGIGAPRP